MAIVPDQQLPPLTAIRVFEAASRHGSFTDAASELGMTQAAVSYQIKLLEDRVGQPLFQRRSRGVSLTPVGAALARPAGEALEMLRAAFSEARQQTDGTLVISVLATFASQVLAPRLGDFQISHPQVTTRVEVDHRMVNLQAGEASVAIRAGHGPWPGLRADFLTRAKYTPMISPAFVARFGDIRTPSDLLSVPLVDADDAGWADWFCDAGLRPPDAGRSSRSLLGTQLLTAQAVRAGQGVGLLSPFYFREMLARGELIQPFDLVSTDGISVWLVYPERRRNAPSVRAFRDWLLGVMQDLGVDPAPEPAKPV